MICEKKVMSFADKKEVSDSSKDTERTQDTLKI